MARREVWVLGQIVCSSDESVSDSWLINISSVSAS
jgi:hypothetical protein